ncbi:hypothetical protein Q3G72_020322 [Acer saccharum]|nr:hypothetical protein Q3G72_020322 [Acer saccharum]
MDHDQRTRGYLCNFKFYRGITEIVHIKHHFLIPIESFTHSLSNPKIEPPKSVAASRRPASLPASRVSGIVSRLRHCLRLQNYD